MPRSLFKDVHRYNPMEWEEVETECEGDEDIFSDVSENCSLVFSEEEDAIDSEFEITEDFEMTDIPDLNMVYEGVCIFASFSTATNSNAK